MRTRAARVQITAIEEALLVALELSKQTWKLVLSSRLSGQRRRVQVSAWDQAGFLAALELAKRRLGMSPGVRAISCQEAGRDGFSVHRFLLSVGVESLVIDASSIAVERKQRRAKTDRLDAERLMDRLLQYLGGDLSVWRVLHVPDEQAEDRRRLHRELEILKKERTRIRCRLQSMLATLGIRRPLTKAWPQMLEQLRQWDGRAVPVGAMGALRIETRRLQSLESQIAELKAERTRLIRSETAPDLRMVRSLLLLKAVGEEVAWYVVMECFGFRRFANQKQVSACAGLAPTPYASGESRRELGIGKDGNRRLRWILVELAWGWLRYQPASALSRWYRQRCGTAGSRQRRIGIVALARRLMVALWRYLEHGIVPDGAVLKAV